MLEFRVSDLLQAYEGASWAPAVALETLLGASGLRVRLLWHP